MYLVDTSVWVDFLRGQETRQVRALDDLLAGEEIVGTTPTIIQELLEGADSPARFDELRDPLGNLLKAKRDHTPARPGQGHRLLRRAIEKERTAG